MAPSARLAPAPTTTEPTTAAEVPCREPSESDVLLPGLRRRSPASSQVTEDPTSDHYHRPLPDQHQAAALWWRLVPHLGPAAPDVDAYDLLTPSWNTLNDLVGEDRGDYLRRSPPGRRSSLPSTKPVRTTTGPQARCSTLRSAGFPTIGV